MSTKKHFVRRFFSSIKLTIVLLIMIAGLSVLGTLIPQQQYAAEVLSGRFNPGLVAFLQALQFFDIFHSVWFILLILLLALNLIFCSWTRFPVIRGRIQPSQNTIISESFRTIDPAHIILTDRARLSEERRILSLLKKRYATVEQHTTQGATFFQAEKGKLSYLGAYIVHVSVLVIIVGVIIGFFFGFEASMDLVEGQASDRAVLKGGKGVHKLGFTVRCDRFILQLYNNGAPKLFRSDITFLKDNKIFQQGSVLVNHPVSVDGIRFYQANYGIAAEDGAVLSYRKNGGAKQSIKVKTGTEFVLPGSEARVKVLRIDENLMETMGPAVNLQIISSQKEIRLWVFQQYDRIRAENPWILRQMPILNPALFDPWMFSLESLSWKYYTGLQVSRDPGAPVVAMGGILLILGFIVAFFYAHRRVFIRIDDRDGKTRVSITGWSSKNPVALNREITLILKRINSPEELL